VGGDLALLVKGDARERLLLLRELQLQLQRHQRARPGRYRRLFPARRARRARGRGIAALGRRARLRDHRREVGVEPGVRLRRRRRGLRRHRCEPPIHAVHSSGSGASSVRQRGSTRRRRGRPRGRSEAHPRSTESFHPRAEADRGREGTSDDQLQRAPLTGRGSVSGPAADPATCSGSCAGAGPCSGCASAGDRGGRGCASACPCFGSGPSCRASSSVSATATARSGPACPFGSSDPCRRHRPCRLRLRPQRDPPRLRGSRPSFPLRRSMRSDPEHSPQRPPAPRQVRPLPSPEQPGVLPSGSRVARGTLSKKVDMLTKFGV